MGLSPSQGLGAFSTQIDPPDRFAAAGAASFRMAEGVGFEPTKSRPLPVFKTGAFNRSATPPQMQRIDAGGSGALLKNAHR